MEATALRTSPVRITILNHDLRSGINNLRSSQVLLPSRVCRFSGWRRMKQKACCYAAAEEAGGLGASPATSVKRMEPVAGAEKVSAVLFDMDGVLCNSEEPSRQAAVDVFAEMGVQVTAADFVPFMGTGEANFLGGVARDKGVKGFDPLAAKKRFFEIYLEKYARPNSGLGYPGSLELILQCKSQGLKVAVASSADRIKVDANLAAAGLSQSIFDAIVSADAFNNLKPAPDIFLAAARMLNVPPHECVVIEDAPAGVQAANAAKMRCIAVTTTLPKEKLVPVGPSLIRKDIANISLNDIINSGRSDMSQSAHLQQFKNYISDMEMRGAGQEVPEFPSKLDWLNANPLQLKRDLQGKVVILDFWTYCCVNCMHVLPDLDYLEKKYIGKPFSVIGVHSAKFDNEKDLGAIRNAVLRYEITHPVVNDADMILWRQLGVNSWPTFVVVSPNGKLLAQFAGEGHRKDLDYLVEAALQYYGEKKLLDNHPIPQILEKDKDTRLLSSPLKFPGKLVTDLTNNRLFISDSNHHRIVVTDLEGNFIMQIGGTGEEVLRDGAFEYAAFNRPQGLAYNPKKDVLYVADTENHALREIDFVNQNVRTLAGNGEKGSDYKGGKKGMAQVLNSPWDVCIDPSTGIVYIAMAGQHQIWEHNILDGITRAFSGDGYERNLNGQSSTSTSFAQPSGISLSSDMKELYVADSESSSIRAVNVKTGGSRILAGGDPLFADNLFKFGDHDGIGTDAQFQHPLGVLCSSDGLVYIADSYNHKIKVMDPVSRKVSTIAGTGSAGFKDGYAQSAQLSEPAGIAQGGKGKLFVADTNNNVIRLINLKGGEVPMVHTLELKGVESPSGKPKSPKRLQRRSPADIQLIRIEPISAMKGDLLLEILLPSEFHFTKEAASKFEAEVEPIDGVLVEPMDGVLNSDGSALLHFERPTPNSATVRVNCKVYYCKEDEVCLYQTLAFEVPFRSDTISSSTAEVPLSFTLKPKTRSS